MFAQKKKYLWEYMATLEWPLIDEHALCFLVFYVWLNSLNKYWHTVHQSDLFYAVLLGYPLKHQVLIWRMVYKGAKFTRCLFVNTINSSYGRFVLVKLHLYTISCLCWDKRTSTKPLNLKSALKTPAEVQKWSWTHKRYVKLIKC